MGYMRHHAIIVTSWNRRSMLEARNKAKKIFPYVSEISPETTNGYYSLFIPPDGSKEGWDESDEGNERRNKFLSWLTIYSIFDWVEVQFGDDEGVTRICRHSDEYRWQT